MHGRNDRRPLALMLGLGLILSLGACGKKSAPPEAPSLPELPPSTLDIPLETFPQWRDPSGMAQSVIGGYWLSHNPNDLSIAHLEPMVRDLEAHGDLFALSIRPFMKATDLRLTGLTPAPGGGFDYDLEFRHPIAMPIDLERPATAVKRVDLFLFDVNLLVVADGTDSFFQGTITTNLNLLADADGYRQIGPLADMSSLGITQANTFPYRLLTGYDAGAPLGNYDPQTGWDGADYLAPTGYDVVPQGAVIATSLRGPATLPAKVGVLLLAKYMDPRSGSDPDTQRANRLPDPTNPSAIEYFLPEACGDIQIIKTGVGGELNDGSNTETASITLQVLDWDRTAAVAADFPNIDNVSDIRKASGLLGIAASVPLLDATGEFPITGSGSSFGLADEWAVGGIDITNTDQTLQVTPNGVQFVPGFVRVRDSQDIGSAPQTLLDEELQPVASPVGFELSTRWQKFAVPVRSSRVPPTIQSVSPSSGTPGQTVDFTATLQGPAPTTWDWNFGGGATPNTSTSPSPSVILASTGSYAGQLIVSNAYGTSEAFPFTIIVSPSPVVMGVFPTGNVGHPGEDITFTVTTQGGVAENWSWDFGGAASPNTPTSESPTVTLNGVGNYDATVIVTNSFGSSGPFPFVLTVLAATPPEVLSVFPTGGIGTQGGSVQFSATLDGPATAWSWDFGGGTVPSTSIEASPIVNLGIPGDYDGTVTAANEFGISAEFAFQYSVSAQPQPPTVLSVTPTGTLGLEGTGVNFSASATNSPTTWSWNFGGGALPNTSSSPSPDVVLASAGTYTGTVTAANAQGASPAFEFEFTVSLPAVPVIQSVDPTGTIGISGDSIEFSAIATGDPTSWSWNFDGGASPNTSTAVRPVELLGIGGTYDGTVTATNAGGTSAPFPFNFTVSSIPAPVISDVSPTGEAGSSGQVITFDVTASNNPNS